jgi:hypothetical protein
MDGQQWTTLVSIVILLFIGLWIWSKIQKQTMVETIGDIRDLIGGNND